MENRFLGKISNSQLSELSKFEISEYTRRKLEFYSSRLPALLHSLKLQVKCLNQYSDEVTIGKESIGYRSDIDDIYKGIAFFIVALFVVGWVLHILYIKTKGLLVSLFNRK